MFRKDDFLLTLDSKKILFFSLTFLLNDITKKSKKLTILIIFI